MQIRLLSAVLLATGCVEAPGGTDIEPFVSDGKADGEQRLRYIDKTKVEVDEPSDLVFAKGDLYTVSDSHSKIYKIARNGDVKSDINIDASDLEALAYQDGQFLVGEESKGRVSWIDKDGKTQYTLDIKDAVDENSGIEGLTIGRENHLFVMKEKNPGRLFEFDADGKELFRMKIEFTTDASAITMHNGRLYVLGDEDRSLYRLDKDWEVDYAWELPMDTPEGLAFDGSTLYIVSDQEKRLYEFELD